MTHREFTRRYPEFRDIPEFMEVKDGRMVRFMDMTLTEFREAMRVLERRVKRGEKTLRESRCY